MSASDVQNQCHEFFVATGALYTNNNSCVIYGLRWWKLVLNCCYQHGNFCLLYFNFDTVRIMKSVILNFIYKQQALLYFILAVLIFDSNAVTMRVVGDAESANFILPGMNKYTVLIVSINGIPVNTFVSGGDVSGGYAISPSTRFVQDGDHIKKIAEAMVRNGIVLEDAYIEVFSSVKEREIQELSERIRLTAAALAERSSSTDSSAHGDLTTRMNQLTARRHKQAEDFDLIKQSMSQGPVEKMQIFLKCCLHAEAAFIDKSLYQARVMHQPPTGVVDIFGNRDPCFQCQVLLDKLSKQQEVRIRYFSRNMFSGACMLPAEVCEFHGASSYTQGRLYSTRKRDDMAGNTGTAGLPIADTGSMVVFEFEPSSIRPEPGKIQVFDNSVQ